MANSTRRLLLAGCASAIAVPFARAQNRTRRLAVGYTFTIRRPDANPFDGALSDGLRELNWIEGRNLIVDRRYTADGTQHSAIIAELLALKPNVLLVGPASDQIAKVAAAFLHAPPIVFIADDPLGTGLVKSLAHPGGISTGFSSQSLELWPKRMSLLKEAVPALTKVGLLEYREGDAKAHAALALLNDAARSLGIGIVHDRVAAPDELESIFERWTRLGVHGYMTISNIWFAQTDTIQRLSGLALKYRIATCTGLSQAADAGVLMSYAVDYAALFGQSAKLIDRILKGADPADIPIEQPKVFELVLNKRTARAIGIEFPRSLIAEATRVID